MVEASDFSNLSFHAGGAFALLSVCRKANSLLFQFVSPISSLQGLKKNQAGIAQHVLTNNHMTKGHLEDCT